MTYPHLLVCLDEDKRTTLISSHYSIGFAKIKLLELEQKYPNGAFDIWPNDGIVPPRTLFDW